MLKGIIVVDKPQGFTSHDVVAKIRGIIRQRSVGHSGTLDPMATGVLPVFVGRATRAVDFLSQSDKEYIATVRLGITTDTYDITGQTLAQSADIPPKEQVLEAVQSFFGEIDQRVPAYSAVKIDGQKLYSLARKGKTIDLPVRRVHIKELEVTEFPAPDQFTMRVYCSKGTYIRSLAHDIGQKLGCGAALSGLVRTKAGCFDITQAVTLEQIAQGIGVQELGFVKPLDSLFAQYDRVDIDTNSEKICKNGAAVPWPGGIQGAQYRVYSQQTGEFLALCRYDDDSLVTIKNFFEV